MSNSRHVSYLSRLTFGYDCYHWHRLTIDVSQPATPYVASLDLQREARS